MSLVSLAPAALARDNERDENRNDTAAVKTELRMELRDDAQEMKARLKQMARKFKFTSRAVTVTGKITAINTANPAAPEVTIFVASVGPNMPKHWPTSTVSYPTPSTSLTLKLSDKSPLYRGYWGKMKLAEMAVGDEVRAVLKFNEDGSLSVKWFQDKSLHVMLRKSGTVKSIDAANGTFVMEQPSRTVTVKTTSNTKFVTKQNTAASFANLKVGDAVKVQGIINLNTKVVAATSVKVVTPATTTP